MLLAADEHHRRVAGGENERDQDENRRDPCRRAIDFEQLTEELHDGERGDKCGDTEHPAPLAPEPAATQSLALPTRLRDPPISARGSRIIAAVSGVLPPLSEKSTSATSCQVSGSVSANGRGAGARAIRTTPRIAAVADEWFVGEGDQQVVVPRLVTLGGEEIVPPTPEHRTERARQMDEIREEEAARGEQEHTHERENAVPDAPVDLPDVSCEGMERAVPLAIVRVGPFEQREDRQREAEGDERRQAGRPRTDEEGDRNPADNERAGFVRPSARRKTQMKRPSAASAIQGMPVTCRVP